MSKSAAQPSGWSSPRAATICAATPPFADAPALLQAEDTPQSFVSRLMDGERAADALRFLGFALERYRALWWGCLCCWLAAAEQLSSTELEALRTVVQWLCDRREPRRRDIEQTFKKQKLRGPVEFLARAAFYAEGSMIRADLKPTPAPPEVTPKLIGAGVVMAANRSHASAEYNQLFAALGLAIGNGKYRLPGAEH